MRLRRSRPIPVAADSAFKGFRFPPEIVDHGRLKARLRPMRGPERDYSARGIIRGHALMQNIRRGHYELGIDARTNRRNSAVDPLRRP